MLLFGPICARVGRRFAFILFQVLAFLIVPVACFVPQTYWQILSIMPVFAFIVQAFHAGYAIYFPELFPTRLRGTGSGFCFNLGRIVAAVGPFIVGTIASRGANALDSALELLFYVGWVPLVGLLLMPWVIETRERALPD